MSVFPTIQEQFTQNTNANIANVLTSPSQSETTANQCQYPVKTFRIFGFVQIAIGVICIVVSVIGIIIDITFLMKSCSHHRNIRTTGTVSSSYYTDCNWRNHSKTMAALDISSAVCSGWFALTGVLPFCMSKTRIKNWKCLKIAFMVCSIIGASVFVPVVFGLGIIGAFLRHLYTDVAALVVLSSALCVFAFIQFVFSIVTASYCCCCSPWNLTHQTVTVVYIDNIHPTTNLHTSTQMTEASGQFYPSQNERAQLFGMDHLACNTEHTLPSCPDAQENKD